MSPYVPMRWLAPPKGERRAERPVESADRPYLGVHVQQMERGWYVIDHREKKDEALAYGPYSSRQNAKIAARRKFRVTHV